MLVKKVTDYRCHDVIEHAHYLQMFAVNKEVILITLFNQLLFQ